MEADECFITDHCACPEFLFNIADFIFICRFLLDEYDIYSFSSSVVIKAMQYALSYHMIAVFALA
jgi:hypothetical protein